MNNSTFTPITTSMIIGDIDMSAIEADITEILSVFEDNWKRAGIIVIEDGHQAGSQVKVFAEFVEKINTVTGESYGICAVGPHSYQSVNLVTRRNGKLTLTTCAMDLINTYVENAEEALDILNKGEVERLIVFPDNTLCKWVAVDPSVVQ